MERGRGTRGTPRSRSRERRHGQRERETNRDERPLSFRPPFFLGSFFGPLAFFLALSLAFFHSFALFPSLVLSISLSLFLFLLLFIFLSLGLGRSADHSNAPYHNYDCRHCHVTARTVRSRINETASKTRDRRLPSPALHLARSATPAASPSPRHSLPLRCSGVSRSLSLSRSLSRCRSSRDSAPCDRPPLVSPPFPYLTLTPFPSSVRRSLSPRDGS